MPDPKKIRSESLRWVLILTLNNARPEGANEAVILATAQGVFPDATQLEVRRELDYLHERELVKVTREPSGRWVAHITRHGIDLAEYTVDCEPGIARPRQILGRMMGKRSKISGMPSEVRAWLDAALIDRNFAGYEQLSAELKSRGYDISKSSLHRHGEGLEERLQALKLASEQAKAIVESCPDEGDAMGEALTRLVQEKMFDALLKMQVAPEKQTLSGIAKSIAEVAKASTQQKKWAYEMRQKVAQAADEVAALSKEAGLSDETAATIRAKILGIAE